MAHELPELPFDKASLSPHISPETLDYHHGKHHAGYVEKLNAAVDGTGFAELSVEETLAKAKEEGNRSIFDNAAQHFNHCFYWQSLSPNGGGPPTGAIAAKLEEDFGSFEAFKAAFAKEAASHFGSGWVWLVRDATGQLQVMSTHDADTPVAQDLEPILTCDVWEHAYYIDYRNARPDYIAAFWDLVNWDFANANLG
ncbi:MAG: superoxide dismutase [Myxococcota bacterium]